MVGAADIERARERVILARHAVLDAAADGLLTVPYCQELKAALEHADLLCNIAAEDVRCGDVRAASRLGEVVDITAAVKAALKRRPVPA